MNDFKKLIKDFLADILKTYPELTENLDDNLQKLVNNDDTNIDVIFKHCEKVYPERFFDILYQNEKIFEDKEVNTMFLPGIDFKYLWGENISENTRNTLWKYLQLILFAIVSSLSNEESFGDTARLFEAINENEFKDKLEETIKNMQDMFTNNNVGSGDENSDGDTTEPKMPEMPNPEDIHSHLEGMLDGKLGKLAKDIANETAKDLDIDLSDSSSAESVFQNLFKKPDKLMSLVKNVGNKLDEKMKSGDIKESELLAEASEMMNKMKNMPGMGNLRQMFGKMGMGGKMDINAMRNNIAKNMRGAKQRERMKEKLDERRRQMEKTAGNVAYNTVNNENTETVTLEGGLEKTFYRTGEAPEKTMKRATGGNKKKKRKKKK